MQALQFISEALRGRRTYVIVALAIGYLLLCQFTNRPPDELILQIFAFLGLGFLRAAFPRTASTSTELRNTTNYGGFPVVAIAAICLLIFFLPGCALQRPYIQESTTNQDGTVSQRTVKSTAVALWPATSELAKGRLSAGKTLSVGVEGQVIDANATTNDVEVLRQINRMLGR